MKVRKKPVVVDAVVYNGKLPTDPEFAALEHEFRDNDLWIFNYLEKCFVRCPAGHWIVRGVKGEYYPVEPDAMQQTYEPLYEDDSI